MMKDKMMTNQHNNSNKKIKIWTFYGNKQNNEIK